MNLSRFPICQTLLLVFVYFAGLPLRGAGAPPSQPNILFILADDMGPGDLGCYGGTIAPTPRLDRLAKEGTRFDHFYVAAPICSPSRAGFITGTFPARWRITSFLQTRQGNRDCEQADYLDPAAPSLARVLHEAGYATAHYGKWHLGGGRDVTNAPPFAAYGFDEHAGTYESPEPHPDITATNWIWSMQDKVKRWDRTAFFVDKTLDFLKRHPNQPAFVNVWFDDVHTPWVPDEQSDRKATPQNFIPVLKVMDRQIGRLMDGLRELGIDDRTLVVFASDNGALPTFKGDRSAGLRGSKLSLYEGGIRLPFIVRWPGQVPAGRVDDQTIFGAVDLLPTLARLASANLPAGVRLDGEDLSTSFFGKTMERQRPLFWEYGRNETSFKYPSGQNRSPNVALREGRWKLLIQADGTQPELYNVVTDRGERTNVAQDHPEVTARLSRQALHWRRSLPSAPIHPR